MNVNHIELTDSGDNEQELNCPICGKAWYWLVDNECLGEIEPCRHLKLQWLQEGAITYNRWNSDEFQAAYKKTYKLVNGVENDEEDVMDSQYDLRVIKAMEQLRSLQLYLFENSGIGCNGPFSFDVLYGVMDSPKKGRKE